MGTVVELDVKTRLPIDPNKVLQGAVDKLDYVLVLGIDKDGQIYAACSDGDMHRAVYIASKFVHKELAGDYG